MKNRTRIHVNALACSKPPKGRARWTLRLLENKVVELNIVDRASDHRARKQLVEEGFEAVLSRKQRAMPAVARIFDGEKEAKLT